MYRRRRKPKTEELLSVLLWGVLKLMQPTYRNLNESYESWAYRTGFQKQLDYLEAERILERHQTPVDDRLYRLTEMGRLHALGGRDPEVCWNRSWDGIWRLVAFDVPIKMKALRDRLRNQLKAHGFGKTQCSFWMSPFPIDSWIVELNQQAKVRSLLLFEGNPCGGESPADIVYATWNFDRINDLYEDYLLILKSRPKKSLQKEEDVLLFQQWAEEEKDAWFQAVSEDPLLPNCLLPRDYLGKKAWKTRQNTLTKALQQLQSFRL